MPFQHQLPTDSELQGENAMAQRVTAQDEYKKNPQLLREDVQELLKWIGQQPNLPAVTELHTIRFLHSCYYDMDAAKKCIKKYYHIRLTSPAFFGDRDVNLPNLKAQLDVVQFALLPATDPAGNQILFHRLQQFEPSKYVFCDSAKLLAMCADAALQTKGTHSGMTILFDMRGVKLGHLLRLSLFQMKIFFAYVQEAMPVRLKAIHVINTLPIIDKIMFMIKPFLKKELLKLVHFHSSDYSEIQEFLPKNCLPSDFGGDLPSADELHENFKVWMQEERETFLAEDNCLKSQMKQSKKAKPEPVETPPTPFRQLELD